MANKIKNKIGKYKFHFVLLLGVTIAYLLQFATNKAVEYTSTDKYCFSCHLHDHAEESWRFSPHVNNKGGIIVHCVDCHLPPKGHGHLLAKAKHGSKDLYGMLFKDSTDFMWASKRNATKANEFTYQESCLKCHSNLFPTSLSVKGEDSHLYYEANKNELTCLNCHLHVGHYNPNALHASNLDFGLEDTNKEIYTDAHEITSFKNFTEKIPGTSVSFDMIAVPAGEFKIGSPKGEDYRKKSEGPVKNVEISRFFMAKIEVSWNEYLAFFNETASEGRKETTDENDKKESEVDVISGATPPWGAPDQGWGKGIRPAITMSYHAAEVYCKWLSQVTGKKYRLPTEAEWEYAARGGKTSPYFFEGEPSDYSKKSTWNKIFGQDTSVITRYVIYDANSEGKTQTPNMVKENPFGLVNMLGNVSEFCSDWYSPKAYTQYKTKTIIDPKGPAKGKEHVVRGGAFNSDASAVRSAARDYTQTKKWLKTDPQMPKSIWWYSDCVHVGFRVVCEVDSEISEKELVKE